MSVSINVVATQYESFLKAGQSYGTVMRKIAVQLNGTPCPKLIEALAHKHAKFYECEFVIGARGAYVFEVDGTRLESARKCWERNVTKWFAKKTNTTSKQVDRVALRAKSLKKDFTKAELRKLVALLAI